MVSERAIIQAENLYKRYGSTNAVEDISFEVHPGEIFGIIGPNGAGKTTTVEILAGMRQPSSGQVRVLGLDPQREVNELRQRTGIQLQSAALPDRIHVWEALDLFASFYRRRKSPRDLQALLETWGLAEKRSATFASLSGGQKQRLLIALALVNDPELVFLDELTTGLDPQARRMTWDLIRAVQAQGKTVVLVTHFMDEAEKLCDRIAIIDQGRMVALDSPRKLIENLHAETCVQFTTSNGFHPEELNSIPGVTRTIREGDQVSVYGSNLPGGPSLLLQVASALGEIGQSPADLHTQPASLEDVFLSLTVKQIRDR